MATKIIIQPKKQTKLDRYAGEWVVFVKNNIITHGKILTEVMAEAKKQSLQDKASVFRVPRKDEGPYSCLNASIGSLLAARRAGQIPKMTPMTVEIPRAIKTTVKLRSGLSGVLSSMIWLTIKVIARPIKPPSRVIRIASIKN